MLKKMLLLLTLFFCLSNLNAQEKYNLKLGVDVGHLLLLDNIEHFEFFFNVEPQLKILENTFIGLRFGLTLNSHVFENNNFQFYIDDKLDHAILSFVPTIDYYFKVNNFRPYIGLGLGIHLLPGYIDVYQVAITNPFDPVLEGRVDKRLGFLVRGGVELRKFRFGLEYNFIPTADIKIPNGEIIGTVDNSYLGLSVGFIIKS